MTAKLNIGWAGRDITPEQPVMLRGQFNLRVATRINDRLTTTALAMETEAERVIIVSIDAVAVEHDVTAECARRVAERIPGFTPENFIISATHTHTGPFSGCARFMLKEEPYLDVLRERYPDYLCVADYTHWLVERITDAACEAWEKREAGSIGWGYAYAVIGENRRVRYFDDSARMYGNCHTPDFSHIEGHVDHGLNLLTTYDSHQHLTGMLVNVPCPSQTSESADDMVSADYWHETRTELRKRYGDTLFVLPQCSAAGDLSPHRMINTRAEDRMLQLKYGDGLNRKKNQGLRRDIARRIVDAIADAEPAIRKDLQSAPVLEHKQLHLELPHWTITEKEYAEARDEIQRYRAILEAKSDQDPLGFEVTTARSRIEWYQRVIDRHDHPLPSVPAHVHVLRLGDMAVVTAPFEYYLDFGDRIKGRSPAVQTFIVQLSGSAVEGASGYLPTRRAAAGCSYGAVPASCSVAPEGGQIIVDQAIATLESMFGRE